MVKTMRISKAFIPAAFFGLAGLVLAGGAQAAGYGLDTPIQIIAAQPDGAAVLNKDIPGLLTNENYDIFKAMSLKQVSALSGGKLDRQTLAQTEADLSALPANPDKSVQKINY